MLYNGEDSGIHIESSEGKGSTFWFKIDVGPKQFDECEFFEEDESLNDESFIMKLKRYQSFHISSLIELDSKIPKINPKLPSEANNNKIFTILIVDDDPVNVMIMEKYLQFYKISYLVAMNGLEAVNTIKIEILEKNREISAILMDCNMPIMDGFKATENILELLAKNNKPAIPIIAVTANVTNSDMELCLKSGMKTFLGKPVKRKDLGETLQKMFKIKLYD